MRTSEGVNCGGKNEVNREGMNKKDEHWVRELLRASTMEGVMR